MTQDKASWLDLWTAPLTALATGKALAETAIATNGVITKRVPMILEAFASPVSAKHSELALMGTEKVKAFKVSSKAAREGSRTLKAAFNGQAAAAGRLSGSGWLSPMDWWGIAERNMTICSTLWSLPGEMLAPYHQAVTANAKRLGV
jgi:hypothetical protein